METVLPSKMRTIHQQIAEWYERNPDLVPRPYVKHLAHHWRKAEKYDLAIGYYSKAAEKAMREFSHRKSTKLLLKTINLQEKLLEGDPHITMHNLTKWHRQLGESFYNIGELDKATTHLNKAIEIMKETIPQNLDYHTISSLILHHDLGLATNLKEFGTSRKPKVKKRRKIMATQSSSSELVRVLLCFAQVSFYKCQRTKLGNCSLASLVVGDSMGPGSSELLRSIMGTILTAGILGQDAEDFMRIGRTLFDNQYTRRSWQVEAMYYSGKGECEKSRTLFDKSIKESEEISDLRTFLECALYQSFDLSFQGAFEDALDLVQRVFSTACTRGDLQMQVLSLVCQVHIAYSRGLPVMAKEKFDEIETYFASGINYSLDQVGKILFFGLLGVHHYMLGEYEKSYHDTLQIDKMVEEKEIEPTVWFTFVGLYYCELVKIALMKKQESWTTGKHKDIQGLSLKKLSFSINKVFKLLEDYHTVFNCSLPAFFIIKGLLESDRKKTLTCLENAISASSCMKFYYWKALSHFWFGQQTNNLSTNYNITDNKFNHTNTALSLFTEQGVFHAALLWF
eukprot:TRINITY_DN7679_c0_g1_i1.p1 TRINITY_DN7679_c0_g1~~TRINITY_DN7679_c0_g1_i1.p1  ORF type:complete len:567 (+),score=98.18 TRINITY_DN7679_c0_g1_i1:1108-2808(+)